MINHKTKLANARCRVIMTDPWYGVIASRITWIKYDNTNTMGVRVMRLGKVECLYSPDFVLSLSNDQLIAVIKHEIEHVIRGHIQRSMRYKNKADLFKIYNVATDWVINGPKESMRIQDLPLNGCFIPTSKNNFGFTDLSGLDESFTAEQFYDWLLENTENNQCGHFGSIFDDHSIWATGDATAEEIRNTAKQLARTAGRLAGSIPGHLKEDINELQKPEINWVNKLRNCIGRNSGGKRWTYSKRNRKIDKFGIKGCSKRNRVSLNVMIDTSGSVSNKMLCKFFTEIENASSNFKIRLIEFDYEVQSVKDYHRGDWKSIKVSGRGGTSFANCLKYIEDNGIVGKMNVLLTDGEDYIPHPRPYPFLWIIVGSGSCGEFWGDVIRLKEDYID